MEVGFGDGEFLIKQSNLNKDSLFIGCEVYLNGFSKVLNKINDIQSEDILKVTKKYLRKPFLSIYGEEKICNKINKLWIKNF